MRLRVEDFSASVVMGSNSKSATGWCLLRQKEFQLCLPANLKHLARPLQSSHLASAPHDEGQQEKDEKDHE